MSSAIRGTVLAGRYRLEERVHSNPDGATWRARDTALDRQVSVYVMRPGHPFAADVADAARRAALVDDPRLVRVLNVGVDDDLNFVVSEYVDGDTLGSLVERSPLTPVAARRIVGEVAEGLDGASKRGLHHLRLTPRSVVVDRDGRVKIFGTAVEAAAAGLEPAHATRAQRIDATGLIALLYSGLTGRWPLGDAGFPPAPRGENGGPVPPATLVRGVPDDLNALCDATLGPVNEGPRSPSELVLELSPWPSAAEAPVRPVGAARNPAVSSRPTAAPLAPDQPLTVRTRGAAGPRGRADSSTPGGSRTGSSRMSTGTPGAGVPGVADASGPPTGSLFLPQPPMPTGPISTGWAPRNRRPGNSGGSTPVADQNGSSAPESESEAGAGAGAAGNGRGPFAPPEHPGAGDPRTDAEAFRSPPVVPGFPSSTPPAGSPRPPNGNRPNPTAGRNGQRTPPPRSRPAPRTPRNGTKAPHHAAGPGSRPRPDEAPRTTSARGGRAGRSQGGSRSEEQLLPWSPGWQQGATPPSALESTGGFPIVIPPETPPREQSRLVLFAVGAVLLLGLVFAVLSLRDLGDNSGDLIPNDAVTPLPAATTAAPAPSATEAPAPTTAAETTPAAVAVRVVSVRAIDPQGDGDENNGDAGNVLPGQGGNWKSQSYNSSDFGGLKDGVGLVFRLKDKAAVEKATIRFEGSGGSAELRTADGPDYAGSKVVGKGSLNGGSATIDVRKPVASTYVILWITKLPSAGGSNTIEISEVRLQ